LGKSMRHLALVVIFLVAGLSSAFAYDTPKALLDALYYPYSQGDDYNWDDWHANDWRSKSLNALFDADDAATPEGDVGRIDFDPYIDSQDYDLADLKIGDPAMSGDTATVEVTFANFGDAEHLTYSLVKEGADWKIDDVTSHNPDSMWSLRALLTAPM
jgi:hypothetical protein